MRWPANRPHRGNLSKLLAFVTGLVLGYQAAAQSSAEIQVEAVAPNVLAIQINTAQVTSGRQLPFALDRQRDQIDTRGSQHRWVRRNGEIIGALVGRRDDLLFTFDRFSETPLDLKKLERPEQFSISSSQDPRYRAPLAPPRPAPARRAGREG